MQITFRLEMEANLHGDLIRLSTVYALLTTYNIAPSFDLLIEIPVQLWNMLHANFKVKMFSYQIFVYLSKVIRVSQALVSSDEPVSLSQSAKAIITIIPIMSFLLLCMIVGVLVYCVCQPGTRRTAQSNSLLTRSETSLPVIIWSKLVKAIRTKELFAIHSYMYPIIRQTGKSYFYTFNHLTLCCKWSDNVLMSMIGFHGSLQVYYNIVRYMLLYYIIVGNRGRNSKLIGTRRQLLHELIDGHSSHQSFKYARIIFMWNWRPLPTV